MQPVCSLFGEYESGFESEYEGGIYDQSFVFDDDDDLYDEEDGSWSDESEEDTDFDDSDNSQDFILEEIPFFYCPGDQETGVA